MPPEPKGPPIGGFVATSEAAALWRARDEDRKDADRKFTRIETDLDGIKDDMREVKSGLFDIKKAEETKAASAEKRNQRIWQVTSGALVSLLVAVIIALWKVFAPIAIGGAAVKPDRVIDKVERVQDTIKSGN